MQIESLLPLKVVAGEPSQNGVSRFLRAQDMIPGTLGALGMDRCDDKSLFIIVDTVMENGVWIGAKVIRPRMRFRDGQVIFGQDHTTETIPLPDSPCKCLDKWSGGQGSSQFNCSCGAHKKYIKKYRKTFTPLENATYEVITVLFDGPRYDGYPMCVDLNAINHFDEPVEQVGFFHYQFKK